MNNKKVLDVGSGIYPLEGADTLDFAIEGVTYNQDLNVFPYKVESSSYDVIHASYVIEHLDDLEKVLSEFHRILKKGGELIIKVPYVSSNISFQDPTHKHFFTYYSLDYFAHNPEKHMEIWFTKRLFNIKTRKLIFYKKGIRYFNILIEGLANKFPIHYENLFKWLFPARELEVVLIKMVNMKEAGE